MAKIVSELILTMDGYAKGTQSPAYYGFYGPEFAAWLKTKNSQPYQLIIGRKTYELFSGMLKNSQDESYKKMVEIKGWIYSKTLEKVNWPNLELIQSDVCEHVRNLKETTTDEIRTIGSLSLVRQLLNAGLVDILRLIICPLVLQKTGIEPLFTDLSDMQFELLNHKILDRHIVILDYQPLGPPPSR